MNGRAPTGSEARADALEYGTRGKTVLAEKVIEKIASQVARDESTSSGSAGGFMGIGSHADSSARPRTSVQLTGNIAALSVEVGLPYPAPLRQGTQFLRERITSRVSEMTGVEVRQVDIRVSWLTMAKEPVGRRRLL
ncbi:Asp23/Gls24 family envelope stress response protein [Arthrobacter sp. AQ5-05]|uniref:Asp23/Gls24 family envelope stress response protein n=1 Tax=Arthrobacter sp. AQ5-05 TaxID=2184581 RepID=UPI000DCB4420|nr:Asp23/Gls24 family envelope stress response protein [Arthrobacter sp. AQ5-05]RAX48076.1 Asp23/Gls24 family envelope stress response protein [Arthrobacter sp. AQ5-05]